MTELHLQDAYRVAIVDAEGYVVAAGPRMPMAEACKLACGFEGFDHYEAIILPPTHGECREDEPSDGNNQQPEAIAASEAA